MTTTCTRCGSTDVKPDRNPSAAELGWRWCASCGHVFKAVEIEHTEDPLDILAHLQDEHGVDDVSFEEAIARHEELHAVED